VLAGLCSSRGLSVSSSPTHAREATVRHGQNFKDLVVDYPIESVRCFSADEGVQVDHRLRIIPIRQEQLEERSGERLRELDVPLLLEWPDERRTAILFAFQEESETSRFSIHRLAHYCLDLAELFNTERVVPVVIFLGKGERPALLTLGGGRYDFLTFRYLLPGVHPQAP
jgi:hypothetical protein